jgi:hypothetical protein
MIVEVARFNTDNATVDKLAAFSVTACGNGGGIPATNWPNGTVAKTAQGSFYYPNGTMAKSSDGSFYYPNGTMAKSSQGSWYYPNGTMARSSQNTWYYGNGTQAGGFQMLVSDSCSRAQTACTKYKSMLASDIEDWRTFAVVQLVAQSNRR